MSSCGNYIRLPWKFWDSMIPHVPSNMQPKEWLLKMVEAGYGAPRWVTGKKTLPIPLNSSKSIWVDRSLLLMLDDVKEKTGQPLSRVIQILYWTGIHEFAREKLMMLREAQAQYDDA